MRRGFTLIEMMAVIGIVAVLLAATVGGYAVVTKAAEKARAKDLVHQVKTALELMHQQNDGQWPLRIAMVGEKGAELDDQVAYSFVSGGTKYLTLAASGGKLVGYDRFGVLSPWGVDILKRRGLSAQLSDVRKHRLWFAVDADGDGYIQTTVGGETVRIRAKAAVWCAGKDGVLEAYKVGLRRDDVYSWSVGDTRE